MNIPMKFQKSIAFIAIIAIFGTFALPGCGGSDGDSSTKDSTSKTKTATMPNGVIVSKAPASPTPITELKASAKEGDEVVMRVVIGGREKPVVSKRAVMTVVDAGQFNNCLSEEDHCPTPWDYCCAAPEDLAKNLATIQVVDAKGQPLALDLLASNLKPMTTLVVKGNVGPRPDQNTLIVNASQIFIEKLPK